MVTTDFSKHVIGDPAATSIATKKIPFLGPFPRTAQSVEDICQLIDHAIDSDHPPKEIYTNSDHEPLVKQYFGKVGEFERLLKPPTS